MIRAEKKYDGVVIEVEGMFAEVAEEMEGLLTTMLMKIPENDRFTFAVGLAMTAVQRSREQKEQVVDATALRDFLKRGNNGE